ncbi:MAG: flagellin [Pseudomonadota bacterium]
MINNASALSALRTLESINNQINTTNQRISSGRSIGSAADGPSQWSIATRIESENATLSPVRDALSIGRATMDVTTTGLSAVNTALQDMRNLLVSARQLGADRASIQNEIAGLLTGMQSTAQSSVLNGENYLAIADSATENMTKSVLSNVSGSGANLSVSTIDLNITDVILTDAAAGTGILDQTRTVGGQTTSVLNIDVSGIADGDVADIDDLIGIVDAAITEVISAEARLGAAISQIDSADNFLSSLSTAYSNASGGLVNANLEEESARLQALQTQQQLAIESLAIANETSASILTLFR